MDIDKQYDAILKTELENRLKRPAKPDEVINADKDSDLVNETLWQLVKDLATRVTILEEKAK